MGNIIEKFLCWSNKRSQRHLIVLVILIVALPRLLFLAVAPQRVLAGFASDFFTLAQNMVDGNGYVDAPGHPHSYWQPAYPVFLAGCIQLAGSHAVLLAKLVQVAFDVVTALIMCMLLVRFYSSAGVVLWALFFSLHPLIVYYVNSINIETLLTLMVTVSAYALYEAMRRPGWARFAVAGLAIGLATLTKTVQAYLPPLLAVIYLLYGRKRGYGKWSHWLVYLCAYMVVLLPWAYRNECVFGRFSPLSGGFGTAFWRGSDPRLFGTSDINERAKATAVALIEFEGKHMQRPPPVNPKSGYSEYERQSWEYKMGWENYKDMLHRPLYLAKVAWLKCSRTLYASEDKRSLHPVLIAVQLPLLLLAVCGYWRTRSYACLHLPASLFLVYVVYFWLMISAGLPAVRYFVPVIPLLLAGSVLGISRSILRADVVSGNQAPHPSAKTCD